MPEVSVTVSYDRGDGWGCGAFEVWRGEAEPARPPFDGSTVRHHCGLALAAARLEAPKGRLSPRLRSRRSRPASGSVRWLNGSPSLRRVARRSLSDGVPARPRKARHQLAVSRTCRHPGLTSAERSFRACKIWIRPDKPSSLRLALTNHLALAPLGRSWTTRYDSLPRGAIRLLRIAPPGTQEPVLALALVVLHGAADLAAHPPRD